MRRQVVFCLLLFLAAALLGGCQRKRLAQGAQLETFSYETIGTEMGSETSFSIVREGEGFIAMQSRGGQVIRTARAGREAAAQATDILRKHNALSWDGYAESSSRVLDGKSFSLCIAFDDGTSIIARGTNSAPKGMTTAMREIENLIDRFPWESEQ